nr:MFS transporter [Ensifer sp. ENS04]
MPTLALAVFFVGATEFMLSAMLSPLAVAFETTPAQAAWLVSSYALSYAVGAPIFGYLSDRIDRRRLLLVSLVLFSIDGLALTIAPSFGAAIVLRVFGGLASAALIPTAFALVADIIPAHRQSAAMGAVMIGMTSGIVSGPVIAGVLTEAFDWRAPFLVTAAGCLTTVAIARSAIPARAGNPPVPKMGRPVWLGRGNLIRPWPRKAFGTERLSPVSLLPARSCGFVMTSALRPPASPSRLSVWDSCLATSASAEPHGCFAVTIAR